jgi:streptogramin lyase
MLITGKGLALLNKKEQTLKLYYFADSIRRRKYYSVGHLNNMTEDSKGRFWIASNDGLIWFDPSSGKFEAYKDLQAGSQKEVDVRVVIQVIVDTKGQIWTGTWGGGLKKFDPITKTWETFMHSPGPEIGTKNIVHGIAIKNDDELWLATQDAWVMIFNTLTKTFTPVYSTNGENNNSIFALKLFRDNLGIVWASGSNTLTKFDTKNTVFKYQPVPDNPLYGSGHLMGSCFQHVPEDSMLYIGVYYSKGLYGMDERTGRIENFPLYPKKEITENVNQLLLDRDNNLWVCYGNGAYIFDRKARRFGLLSTSVTNHNLLQSAIYSIVEDDDGSIWFASWQHGLLHYDKKARTISKYRDAEKDTLTDHILFLFKDSRGNIWTGFNQSGLACINKATGKIRVYNSSNFGIPKAMIGYIEESREGDIFFGMDQHGLGIITHPLSGKDSLLVYNNYNGLSGDRIAGIAKDRQDYIWISTNNGVNRCDTRDMSFQYFSVADGLRSNFLESGLFCAEDGNIYAGASEGFNYFNPASLTASNEKPRVIIHSFRINGKEYYGDVNSLERLSLGHKDASFSFEFAALAFRRNEHINYAYRVKGLEEEWRYAGTNRIAAYSIPHGGNYILQVKSTNGLGEWNDDIYELAIHVRPPFWETWWFIGLCVLSLAVIVFVIIRSSIKRVRVAEERKTHLHKVKADAEMKALRAQMNPHFIFNCMNTIDAYIFKNNTELASAFLNKFSKLIRQVLENSRLPFISIQKDMEALRLYIELEEQRHEFRFTHSISIPGDFEQKNFKIPPLLLQPYVENAILHGLRHREDNEGLLKISFEESADHLICYIEDNGIGRKASAIMNVNRPAHQSLGSIVSHERIGLLNDLHTEAYNVEISDMPGGTGTIVKLTLPKTAE